CDSNVSVRPKGQKELGTRAEVKNLNSFRNVERAINIEIERQIELIEDGGRVVQETRLYDADKNETRSMRSKEEANDYRYFPDPDLLPVVLEPELIAEMRASLPELPNAKRDRFVTDMSLSLYDASVLTSSRELANYFEAVLEASDNKEPKQCANWIITQLLGALNKTGLEIANSPISAQQLGGLLLRITDNTISGKIAKQIFDALWAGEGDDADSIIEAKGLKQVTDSGAIEAIVDEVIANNAGQVEQYRGGKEQLLGFFVGQVMKASKGKANPAQVNEILKAKLTG
ncbi:aspartyl/glutamyl-tRNA amidotransferase subunit B, partial [Methylophaga sp. 41_12_T18]